MEKRLRPLNALLGLVTPADINPAALHDAGFLLSGLEVAISGRKGNVTADVVLFHPDLLHIILCEVKSGANIEADQANAYLAIEPQAAVLASNIDLPRRGTPTIETLYVCNSENSDRILKGLHLASASVPTLAVKTDHPYRIDLLNESHASDILASAFPGQTIALEAPPPSHLPFDHETPVEQLIEPVTAALVQALSLQRPFVTLSALTEQMAPFYAVFGRAGQSQLRKRVASAARQVSINNGAYFSFRAPSGNTDGRVTLLKSPEALDPRGRTQAYQALRQGGRRRRPRVSDPNQTDLLAELKKADDVERAATQDTEEVP